MPEARDRCRMVSFTETPTENPSESVGTGTADLYYLEERNVCPNSERVAQKVARLRKEVAWLSGADFDFSADR